MIVLRDTVEIRASPEQIFEFLAHFKENVHAWHPDHVECRYLTYDPLGEGSVIYIEEYLHGKLHKLGVHAGANAEGRDMETDVRHRMNPKPEVMR